VRVSRIDQPEAVLLAPEQAFFLRENLKLKLLNARLSLLARQNDAARADLAAPPRALNRYFDPASRRTQAAAGNCSRCRRSCATVDLPRIDETLAALATAGAGKLGGAPMRAALWLLALFAIAVAIALFAGNNQGTVTLFWPPYRVDLSLNLVLLLLLATFFFLHAALRALSALFDLPRQALRWRNQQKERSMHALLLDALSHLIAGRFIRARKSAEAALAQEASLTAAGQARQRTAAAHAGAPAGGRERAVAAGPPGARGAPEAGAGADRRPRRAGDARRRPDAGRALVAGRPRAQAAMGWLQGLPSGAAAARSPCA
jgi:uncharacterized integral membrane protein